MLLADAWTGRHAGSGTHIHPHSLQRAGLAAGMAVSHAHVYIHQLARSFKVVSVLRLLLPLAAGIATLQFRRAVLVNDYVGFLLAAWLRAAGFSPRWESSVSDIGVTQEWSCEGVRM